MKSNFNLNSLMLATPLLCASLIHGSAEASDINVVSKHQNIPVCLSFSEYKKFHSVFKSGNDELANRIFQSQESCIVLAEGIEYAVIDSNFRWKEIVIFHKGESYTAYMIPFQGY